MKRAIIYTLTFVLLMCAMGCQAVAPSALRDEYLIEVDLRVDMPNGVLDHNKVPADLSAVKDVDTHLSFWVYCVDEVIEDMVDGGAIIGDAFHMTVNGEPVDIEWDEYGRGDGFCTVSGGLVDVTYSVYDQSTSFTTYVKTPYEILLLREPGESFGEVTYDGYSSSMRVKSADLAAGRAASGGTQTSSAANDAASGKVYATRDEIRQAYGVLRKEDYFSSEWFEPDFTTDILTATQDNYEQIYTSTDEPSITTSGIMSEILTDLDGDGVEEYVIVRITSYSTPHDYGTFWGKEYHDNAYIDVFKQNTQGYSLDCELALPSVPIPNVFTVYTIQLVHGDQGTQILAAQKEAVTFSCGTNGVLYSYNDSAFTIDAYFSISNWGDNIYAKGPINIDYVPNLWQFDPEDLGIDANGNPLQIVSYTVPKPDGYDQIDDPMDALNSLDKKLIAYGQSLIAEQLIQYGVILDDYLVKGNGTYLVSGFCDDYDDPTMIPEFIKKDLASYRSWECLTLHYVDAPLLNGETNTISQPVSQPQISWSSMGGTQSADATGSESIILLTKGDKGDSVRTAQNRLAALNYMTPASVDGSYGGQTRDAVLAFQQINGLTPTGDINQRTNNLLFSDSAASYMVPGDVYLYLDSPFGSYLPVNNVTASQVMSEGRITFDPNWVLLSDSGKAWAVHGSTGWIELNQTGKRLVHGFYIKGGYQMDRETYYANYRPQTLNVYADGTYLGQITLDDVRSAQWVRFSTPVLAQKIRLEVTAVYDTNRDHDLCITEAGLLGE